MTRVAFLGLGAMGGPMAARLLAAGHELYVWNRTPGRGDELLAGGAVLAGTLAEAARGAEVVITMVADPPALEEVVFGADGIAEAIGPGAVWIDMSTVGPTAIRSAAVRLDPVAVVDAPVLGTVPHARAGSLTILVGAEPAVLARCGHVLEVMGTVHHVGLPGAGAVVKLANNATSLATLACLGEVLALTDRAGLDAGVVLDAVGMGPLASAVERWRDQVTGATERTDFRLALARKDLGLAIDEGEALGIGLTVALAAAARYDEAIAAGLGDEDLTEVVATVRA